MRAVIQRVRSAWIEVEGARVAEIGRGLLVLLGIDKDDGMEQAKRLAKRCVNIRIFEDLEGRMNRSLLDITGEILVVSQFTLVADTKKGNRPSFSSALRPEKAKILYDCFLSALSSSGREPKSGIFGAKMLVRIENDGPVTFILEA
ncbi:MAG TPA: D-tyrosyl-tRNA(Tyr) deacylase [bacterium (Candidatus Stahlbacteria)]|nr:D-tyrosyl-tRNA(Tyr) deacylase [Candidatus Stahlbacteria bacterium]